MNKAQQLLARLAEILGGDAEDKPAQAERAVNEALCEAWNACALRMAARFDESSKKKFDGASVAREIRAGLGIDDGQGPRQRRRSAR